jgi:hypothetical protein
MMTPVPNIIPFHSIISSMMNCNTNASSLCKWNGPSSTIDSDRFDDTWRIRCKPETSIDRVTHILNLSIFI